MASFLFFYFYFFRFVGFEPGRQPVTIFLKRINQKEGGPEKCTRNPSHRLPSWCDLLYS
jgi:hypothetical protein